MTITPEDWIKFELKLTEGQQQVMKEITAVQESVNILISAMEDVHIGEYEEHMTANSILLNAAKANLRLGFSLLHSSIENAITPE